MALVHEAIRIKTTGNYNIAIGTQALSIQETGSNNIAIGHQAYVPDENGSNQMRLGNTNIVFASIQVPLAISSDRRWKSNIRTSALGLDFIMKLNPVSYFRDNDISQKSEYGFIAQELDETLRSFGASDNGMVSKDHAGMYNVRYNDLLAPMVKAIQEQQAIIDNQQKQIDELKTLLNKLAQGIVTK